MHDMLQHVQELPVHHNWCDHPNYHDNVCQKSHETIPGMKSQKIHSWQLISVDFTYLSKSIWYLSHWFQQLWVKELHLPHQGVNIQHNPKKTQPWCFYLSMASKKIRYHFIISGHVWPMVIAESLTVCCSPPPPRIDWVTNLQLGKVVKVPWEEGTFTSPVFVGAKHWWNWVQPNLFTHQWS